MSVENLTCSICKLPIEECRKQDEKLINPVMLPVNQYSFKYMEPQDPKDMTRARIACEYVAGVYDVEKKTHYLYNPLSYRRSYEIEVHLPLCVWEGDYTYLYLSYDNLQHFNLRDLPLSSEYIELLWKIGR
jgi:hypothetical protein